MRQIKLNHDCMRDCLLFLESEKNIVIDDDEGDISFEPIFVESIYAAVTKWSKEEVFYAIFNLEQGGYINTSMQYSNNSLNSACVNYITLHGHEFLDSIRDDRRWRNIKKGLNAICDYSLSALSAIANGMTAGAVSAFLKNASLFE